jgi:hypothetical protein
MFFQFLSVVACTIAALPIVQKLFPLALAAAADRLPSVLPAVLFYNRQSASVQIQICATVAILSWPLTTLISAVLVFLIWPSLLSALLFAGLVTVGGKAEALAYNVLQVCPFCTRCAKAYQTKLLPAVEAFLQKEQHKDQATKEENSVSK